MNDASKCASQDLPNYPKINSNLSCLICPTDLHSKIRLATMTTAISVERTDVTIAASPTVQRTQSRNYSKN
jgi:hypothetical protein